MFVLPIKPKHRNYWPIKDLPEDKRKKKEKTYLIAIYTTQTRDLEWSIKDFPGVKMWS